MKSLLFLALHRLTRFFRINVAVFLPGLLFLVLVTAINWRLFVTPLIEGGDTAVNAIQVQNAKHFHELLGNYSRWHFHHPGPFFFYVFGAGEAILYDLLHVVPAPLNGEYIAEIFLSVTFLFLAIYIFYDNIRRPLLPALAVLVSVLFLYAVDTALPGSAMVSLWPPYMSIFCFLLFAASCASLASGRWKHIPLMALSGMILIHAHVAQLLFVTVLGASGFSVAVLREVEQRKSAATLRVYKHHLAAAVAIIALFLFPIATDWAIHHPNNIHQIRIYLRQHHGEHNSLRVILLYTASFFTYYVTPEAPLSRPAASLRDLINPASFVGIYWCSFISALFAALLLHFRSGAKVPLFIKFIFYEIALIAALFFYWSWRIAGPMYTFNGYFFFSVQLLALLAFSCLISGSVFIRLPRKHSIALACALAAPLLLVAGVKEAEPTESDVLRVVSLIKAKHLQGEPKLIVQAERWPVAAGVASYLQRSGVRFCIESSWEFMFGPALTCMKSDQYYHLDFTDGKSPCKPPCSVIYDSPELRVTFEQVLLRGADNVHGK
jgi:hypothetical protein